MPRQRAGIQVKIQLNVSLNQLKMSYLGGSWFEGYGWKVCQCPSCKNHLGWMFETIDRIINNNPLYPSEKGFYGIILDAVITESCKSSS